MSVNRVFRELKRKWEKCSKLPIIQKSTIFQCTWLNFTLSQFDRTYWLRKAKLVFSNQVAVKNTKKWFWLRYMSGKQKAFESRHLFPQKQIARPLYHANIQKHHGKHHAQKLISPRQLSYKSWQPTTPTIAQIMATYHAHYPTNHGKPSRPLPYKSWQATTPTTSQIMATHHAHKSGRGGTYPCSLTLSRACTTFQKLKNLSKT